MKGIYRALNGRLSLEVEGADVKAIHSEVSGLAEVFGNDTCGACQSENVRPLFREAKGNPYYEMKCLDCFAALSFGQHKNGHTLFPKRKDAEGNWFPNNGWVKYNGGKQGASAGNNQSTGGWNDPSDDDVPF